MGTPKKTKPSTAHAKKKVEPAAKAQPGRKASPEKKLQGAPSSAVGLLASLATSGKLPGDEVKVVVNALTTLLVEQGTEENRAKAIANNLAQVELDKKKQELASRVDLIAKFLHLIVFPALAVMYFIGSGERTPSFSHLAVTSGLIGGPVASWYSCKKIKAYLVKRKVGREQSGSLPSAIPSSI